MPEGLRPHWSPTMNILGNRTQIVKGRRRGPEPGEPHRRRPPKGGPGPHRATGENPGPIESGPGRIGRAPPVAIHGDGSSRALDEQQTVLTHGTSGPIRTPKKTSTMGGQQGNGHQRKSTGDIATKNGGLGIRDQSRRRPRFISQPRAE